jgi:putative DNA primase/helicase
MQQHNITPVNGQSKDTSLSPDAPGMGITIADIVNHANALLQQGVALPHKEILLRLLEKIEPVDFREIAFPEWQQLQQEVQDLESQLTGEDGSFQNNEEVREQLKALQKRIDKQKLKLQHYLIISIEQVLQLARQNQWGICRQHDFIYLYNGTYWSMLDVDDLKTFLGNSAEKMGVQKYQARFYVFREHLFKQFLHAAHLPAPQRPEDIVLVNLQNGTFEIGPQGNHLRPFSREDFITYQLPFPYDLNAIAPRFKRYLDQVLPDIERQHVLAEYLGYVFITPGTLKLEKTLLLYGSGANGKSVFFEIVTALLGKQNISGYNLQSLTNESGYQRAKLADILVNYASEINGNMDTAIFKQLVSGEPVEARLPYGQPFMLTHYAKFIFNCNELPRDVEHTNAYFRRFLIIPFDVIIPEDQQDKTLAHTIVQQELSGVFNWVLEGLNRLLKQKKFTDCEAVRQQVEQYKKQSDSVWLFMEERGYIPTPGHYRPVKELYQDYRVFCSDDGGRAVKRINFTKRLEAAGVTIEKKNIGLVAFVDNSIRTF